MFSQCFVSFSCCVILLLNDYYIKMLLKRRLQDQPRPKIGCPFKMGSAPEPILQEI